MTAFMKLRLLGLVAHDDSAIEGTFGVVGADDPVVDIFRVSERDGRLHVTGSERDVLNWCEGSAEDVRRVIRAVVAFAEANDPGRFPD